MQLAAREHSRFRAVSASIPWRRITAGGREITAFSRSAPIVGSRFIVNAAPEPPRPESKTLRATLLEPTRSDTMKNRVLAGLTLAGVAILASCGQDLTQSTAVPAAPSFAKSTTPTCSYSTANGDARSYFSSNKDTV